MKTSLVSLVLFFLLSVNLVASKQNNKIDDSNTKILILPFNSLGIDSISLATAQNLFKFDLMKYCNWNIEETNQSCSSENCAIEFGKEHNAQKSFICSMSKLGEKIIVQFILMNVESSKKILSETTSALSIEDLENVMNRIALSVARGRTS